MPNPEQSPSPHRAVRFDYSSEQTFNTEYLLLDPREALRANGEHWSCGNCKRRVNVTDQLKPHCCVTCDMEWTLIIVAKIDGLPQGYDFLPTISSSAVKGEEVDRSRNLTWPEKILLGSEHLDVENLTLDDDSPT